MMLRNYASILAFTVLLTGCDSEHKGFSNSFAGNYQITDFQFASEHQYWEIRRGWFEQNPEVEHSVLNQFDPASLLTLSQATQTALAETKLYSGFYSSCFPAGCPIYAVAVDNNELLVEIDSRNKLLAFFGDIDTEAELDIWVRYSGFEAITVPVTYEQHQLGYKVMVNWDTTCQLRGSSIVLVEFNGQVSELEQIDTEEYDSCA